MQRKIDEGLCIIYITVLPHLSGTDIPAESVMYVNSGPSVTSEAELQESNNKINCSSGHHLNMLRSEQADLTPLISLGQNVK